MNAHTRIVSEAGVEKALDFLRDGARAIGDAKARVVRSGHMLKHIEALEFKLSDATSNDKRQADARTSARYLEAIEEDAAAAGDFERLKALREAAAMSIEAWRTESSTLRAFKL